jgi:hypothetical protein
MRATYAWVGRASICQEAWCCSRLRWASNSSRQDKTSGRRLSSARRRRSVIPPQTPNPIWLSRESARHSTITGQPVQTCWAAPARTGRRAQPCCRPCWAQSCTHVQRAVAATPWRCVMVMVMLVPLPVSGIVPDFLGCSGCPPTPGVALPTTARSQDSSSFSTKSHPFLRTKSRWLERADQQRWVWGASLSGEGSLCGTGSPSCSEARSGRPIALPPRTVTGPTIPAESCGEPTTGCLVSIAAASIRPDSLTGRDHVSSPGIKLLGRRPRGSGWGWPLARLRLQGRPIWC